MKVIYRPHRGGLSEAMEDKQEFETIYELLDWLVEEHMNAFKKEQVHLTYYGYDHRIDWETFLVTVDCYHNHDNKMEYATPMLLGFCTFK